MELTPDIIITLANLVVDKRQEDNEKNCSKRISRFIYIDEQ